MSIPLHFDYQGKNYEVILEIADSPSEVSIGEKKYKIVGNQEAVLLLKSYIQSHHFDGMPSFKAKLAEIGSDKRVQSLFMGAVKPSEQIDQFLESAVKSLDFRGAVSVVVNGKVLLSKGYGGEITDQTIFHLASVSKQFTAAAIMLLQQRNPHFNVNDRINQHLPEEFQSPHWEKITIHQLLNHTSGMVNGSVDRPGEEREYQLKDLINDFKNEPLNFEPGTAWDYSNPGYWVLGAIIEHESHQTYGEFIQKNIFGPLEMNLSGIGNSYDPKKAAVGYEKKTKDALSAVNNQGIHLSKAYAAGALYSTTEDMRKWDAALYNNDFISEKSRELMFRSDDLPVYAEMDTVYSLDEFTLPHLFKEIDQVPTLKYGYGIFIFKNDQTEKIIAHEGAIPGFRTIILRYPETKSSIIILSNNGDLHMSKIAIPIEEMLK